MASGRKKSTSAKGGARAAKGRQGRGEVDRRFSIILYALAAFLITLSFIPGEAAWAWMRTNLLFAVFGICGWLLGPLVLYLAILMSRGRPVLLTALKGLFLVLALLGLALAFGKTEFAGLSFLDVLKTLLENGRSKVGGGLFGLVFGWSLISLCGRLVARILLVIIFVLAVMVFTGVTPADVGRFFANLWRRRPRRSGREYDEYEEYEEDDYIEEAYTPPPPARRGRAARVDIALDAPPVMREEGRAERVDTPIGPGGSFGVPAPSDGGEYGFPEDEPLIAFDPRSKQPLFRAAEAGMENSDMLLFGEDDPYAYLGGAESKLPRGNLFDVEYVPDAAPPPAPDFDLFGRVAPSQPSQFATPSIPGSEMRPDEAGFTNEPEPVLPPAAQGPAGQNHAEVDALIEKAARPKQDAACGAQAPVAHTPYQRPPLSLFGAVTQDNTAGAKEEMKRTADLLVSTLASFGVQTRILDVSRGPSVTRYEVQPQAGVKISRITNLADDIALNLAAAAGVRIEAPIPGKPAVGIEVPNRKKSTVSIRNILESNEFRQSESPVSMALGKDIAGDTVVADLSRMPHLLIAGSTGSGKSVCVNSIIMSFLYKSSPEDVQMLLIDPKVVELAEYNGIPHLLIPVVTEPRQAARALGYAVTMMEQRYHLFAENNVRDIRSFNKKAQRSPDMEKLPHIVIIIDELADLMMAAGKDVENYICRIAQKARAAGMHLIVATQRPSVDVITGLIKANIPSRIAFAVSSQVDSRTILDGAGAEKLLGMGDMLFMPVGANKPVRVQGTYVKDREISAVLSYVKKQGGAEYDESVLEGMEKVALSGTQAAGGENGEEGSDAFTDPTFVDAVEIALEAGQISTSFLQRRLRLGYARAGRIMDEMESLGIVSGPDGSKPRQVLIGRQQWQEMVMNTSE